MQKVTPIIAVLDKPTAPFDVKKQPLVLMTFIGFLLGCFLGTLALVSGLLLKYLREEFRRSIFGS